MKGNGEGGGGCRMCTLVQSRRGGGGQKWVKIGPSTVLLFFFEFGLMYCDLLSQYIKVRKLFKGGNYSRKYGI